MDPRDLENPGRLLDEALAHSDIKFDTHFDPRTYRPKTSRHQGLSFGWKATAAAALLLAIGAGLHQATAPAPHRASNSLAAAPKAPQGLLPWSRDHLTALSTATIWMGRPGRTWTATTFAGHLSVGAMATDEVVAEGPSPRTAVATGFNQNQAVWTDQAGTILPVPQAQVGSALQGAWVTGGPTALTSFNAAGPYIYVSNGPDWTVLDGQRNTHWALPPTPGTVRTTLAALPNHPATALLLTEGASGQQALYRRTSLQGAWQAVSLPASPITEVVAAGSGFWMLADGKFLTSQGGLSWHTVYTPPKGFTVSTFAIDPYGNGQLALALAPAGQTGSGPLLLSANNGQTWHSIAPVWPNGTAPSTLLMQPDGSLVALLPGPPLVIERWDAVTGHWGIIPLPAPNSSGVGSLAASTTGSLIYSDATGSLFRYHMKTSTWSPIPLPPHVKPTALPSLLMGIGPKQVLVSYPNGWYIFVPQGS